MYPSILLIVGNPKLAYIFVPTLPPRYSQIIPKNYPNDTLRLHLSPTNSPKTHVETFKHLIIMSTKILSPPLLAEFFSENR